MELEINHGNLHEWLIDRATTRPVTSRITMYNGADDYGAEYGTICQLCGRPLLRPGRSARLADDPTTGEVICVCDNCADACYTCACYPTIDTPMYIAPVFRRFGRVQYGLICADCLDRFARCDVCAGLIHPNHARTATLDGSTKMLCGSCYDDLHICADCNTATRKGTGNIYHRVITRGGEQVLICDGCYTTAVKADRVVTCDKCRTTVYTTPGGGTGVRTMKNGMKICYNCYHNTPGISWHHDGYDRHFYMPDETPGTVGLYGVELEQDTVDDHDPYDHYSQGSCSLPDEYADEMFSPNFGICCDCSNIDCDRSEACAEYRHENDPDRSYQDVARQIRYSAPDGFAIVKPDSSLDNGLEIVTLPASLRYLLDTDHLATLCETATENGLSGDRETCGLHIHADRRNFGDSTRKQYRTIGRVIYMFQRFQAELEAAAGRPCCSWADWYHFRPDYIIERMRESVTDFHRECRAYDRYMAVNVTNSNTVEFRLFAGTSDADTVKRQLQLVDNLIAVARDNNTAEIDAMMWHDVSAYHERI